MRLYAICVGGFTFGRDGRTQCFVLVGMAIAAAPEGEDYALAQMTLKGESPETVVERMPKLSRKRRSTVPI